MQSSVAEFQAIRKVDVLRQQDGDGSALVVWGIEALKDIPQPPGEMDTTIKPFLAMGNGDALGVVLSIRWATDPETEATIGFFGGVLRAATPTLHTLATGRGAWLMLCATSRPWSKPASAEKVIRWLDRHPPVGINWLPSDVAGMLALTSVTELR